MKRLALSLWAVIALAAGTGCIPVFTPVVQQDLTTGEKLRSIEAVRRDPAAFVDWEAPTRTADPGSVRADGAAREARIAQVLAWCNDSRDRLVAGPVVLEATVYAPAGTTPGGYAVLNPGLFNPVDRELADLRRARDAGLISAADCTDLEATLQAQARRSPIRRASETAAVAVDLRFTHLDSSFVEWSARGNLKAWWWMAKRVRMMDQAARGAEWRRRSIDEPGIPAPNVYSLPAVFRMRVVGEAGQ
ncbi:MAG: hypothetical protein ACKOJI_05440 [Phycisphaerales bacterium]